MKQRKITYIAHFPRWGCYAASLLTFVERHLRRELGQVEVEMIWQKALTAGFVWDNDLPTDGSKGDWYRCFVAEPVGFVNLALEHVGLSIRIKSVRKAGSPGPDFCLVCWKTAVGVHFGLAQSDGYCIENPDPSVVCLGVDSYRVFELVKE